MVAIASNGEMVKNRRTYKPRVVGGHIMMPADLRRLHKYILEIEGIDHISDEMRAVVESEWPELAHKLPPKKMDELARFDYPIGHKIT